VQSHNNLPEKSDDEEAMLSEAFNVKENSRLGCQLHISDVMDGLEVELAPAE
jgi:2Fe-2S ferredoxin